LPILPALPESAISWLASLSLPDKITVIIINQRLTDWLMGCLSVYQCTYLLT
jgi:hypothetical protein